MSCEPNLGAHGHAVHLRVVDQDAHGAAPAAPDQPRPSRSTAPLPQPEPRRPDFRLHPPLPQRDGTPYIVPDRKGQNGYPRYHFGGGIFLSLIVILVVLVAVIRVLEVVVLLDLALVAVVAIPVAVKEMV